MIRSLWTAATGMQAQALNIDVISNNLANVNTTGFKKSRADFQDLLYETLSPAGVASSAVTQVPTGMQVGLGTRPVAIQKIFMQGDYQYTKNELDIAIEGDGFFQILQPNGEIAYTRAGAFKLSGDGEIVTSDGFLMEPEISIPLDSTAISIGTDGTVSVLQAGETTSSEIGTIELVRPNGEIAYTRAGAFKLSGDGEIVTSDGFLMEPEISIPLDSTAISIGTDGTVSVLQAGETTSSEIGTIELVRFVNPAGLNSIGRNLYLSTSASGDPVTGTAGEDGFGTITQGYLELSNVSVVDEMVNMITAQRAYEINSKSIQASDEMLQMANNLKR
jgi:flagellar basal body rod protein FlgG